MWNNVDIVSRACLGGACNQTYGGCACVAGGTLLGGGGTVGTAGGWVSQLPARLRVKAGIQSVTLQGTESGIRKLDADFTRRAKNRATPRISPGVSEMV